MPIYEYECGDCGKKTEKLVSHSLPEEKKEQIACECGSAARRIVSRSNFELKGTWFKTKGRY